MMTATAMASMAAAAMTDMPATTVTDMTTAVKHWATAMTKAADMTGMTKVADMARIHIGGSHISRPHIRWAVVVTAVAGTPIVRPHIG